MLSSVAYNVR